MILIASVRLALERLRANAARSALTVLGIVIGVGSVVTLVAVGNGSAAQVNSQFSELGANTLTVTSGRGFGGGLREAAGSGTPLTIQDVDAIQRAPRIGAVAPIVQAQANISVGDTTVQSPVVGTMPSYVKVNGLQLASGSFFSDFADARRLQVAVLGATLTSDLGLAPRQAVGSTVNVRGLPYTVIGVLQSQGGAGFVNPDDNLLVPLDTMAGRVTSADPNVSQIRVAAAPDAVSTFGNSVIAALRDSHGLAFDQDNDFLVINPNSLIQAQQASSDNFTRLITAIAAISLVVGGIGIANVMLVAVRERTQEIGIRRAIGAKRRDIVAQFLTEATVLSLLGGLLGVAAGLALAYALPHLADQRTIVSYPAGALALGISAVVGIIAGLGPANQAASLDPAEALRYE
jgi:putative ABC transport system permease protein